MWLQVNGKQDLQLEALLAKNVQKKIDSKEYSRDDLYYVSKVDLNPIKGELNISDRKLELLRQLCQLWYVDILPTRITSHRKIIGPLIVAVKKLSFPIVRYFLRDFVAQQRNFNAKAIALLAETANYNRSHPQDSQ